MRKYVYENAVVYITEPTEAQKENIRKRTEEFVLELAKKGLIDNGRKRRNGRRTNLTNPNARKRNKKTKEKDISN